MASHPDSARAVDVGTVVADTYEITRCIGRGGMGAVWAANHLRLPGKQVAIKVLLADVGSDAESLARFRREAEIASRLGHPNIVQVIDFNTLPDGAPYLVLELLAGESLDQRLARGPLPVDEALAIARQIGAGLAAAHRQGVVHRDLKPQNIFLCPTELGGDVATQVKILDFGISKIRGSQTIKTQESTLLGTPQYMAPEQATGAHDQVGPATDIFALGAIVYEMLCGQPAFAGQTVPEVVFKVVYEQPPPLAERAPHVPAAAIAAVERALNKSRDDRFPTVGAFVEALTGRPLATLRGAGSAAGDGAATAPPDAATADPAAGGAAAALAATVASGNHAPAATGDLPMPSPADLVSGDTGRDRPSVASEAAFAQTVITGTADEVADAVRAAVGRAQPAGRGRGWVAVVVLVAAAGAVAAVGLVGRDRVAPRTVAMGEPPPPPVAPPPATESATPDRDLARAPATAVAEGSTGAGAAGGAPGPASVGAGRVAANPTGEILADRAAEPAVKPVEADVADSADAELAHPDAPPRPRRAESSSSGGRRPADDAPDRIAPHADRDDGKPASRAAAVPPALAPAERALRAGDAREAIRLAKRALRTGNARRLRAAAAALITAAYCAERDLGNAQAWLAKVPPRARRRVRARCAAAGLPLP
ncbi:MAG: serine/threonine protein kinase [Deltaproteobacteria bacterium]|nr:MAG: serine/threonine protein kinase [Deltaproteobacteria bacterium]